MSIDFESKYEDNLFEPPYAYILWQMYGVELDWDIFIGTVDTLTIDIINTSCTYDTFVLLINTFLTNTLNSKYYMAKRYKKASKDAIDQLYNRLDSEHVDAIELETDSTVPIVDGSDGLIGCEDTSTKFKDYISKYIDELLMNMFPAFCRKHKGPNKCNNNRRGFAYLDNCCVPPRAEYFRIMMLNPINPGYIVSTYGTEQVQQIWLEKYGFNVPHHLLPTSGVITSDNRMEELVDRRFLIQSVATRIRRRFELTDKTDIDDFFMFIMSYNKYGNTDDSFIRVTNALDDFDNEFDNDILTEIMQLIDTIVFDGTFYAFVRQLNLTEGRTVKLTTHGLYDPTEHFLGLMHGDVNDEDDDNIIHLYTIIINFGELVKAEYLQYLDSDIKKLTHENSDVFFINQVMMQLTYVIVHEMVHFVQSWSDNECIHSSNCSKRSKNPKYAEMCSTKHGKGGHCQHFMQGHDTFTGHDDIHCGRYDANCATRGTRKTHVDNPDDIASLDVKNQAVVKAHKSASKILDVHLKESNYNDDDIVYSPDSIKQLPAIITERMSIMLPQDETTFTYLD